VQYSVSITTFNRQRKDRKNYFDQAYASYLKAGLLESEHVRSVDIFVGHEKDEWCEKTLPQDIPTHYLAEELPHIYNIEAVLKHVISVDKKEDYHLYLEDDLICLHSFDKIAEWHSSIPNPEFLCTLMDYKPISITNDDMEKGYRHGSFNTFTAILMTKNTIRNFLYRGGFPKNRNRKIKAPDHYFGKQVMQPNVIAVPSLFKHIGLESAAHKRCFDKELGL
jgi:hypothetical protein